MPPKGKTAERLQQEAEAQRARAAALQYLTKTGSGPSQKEIAQQQKEREKWTNPTTQAVQQRLAHLQPTQASGAGNAPTGDNTLAVMAAHRARQMLQGGGVHARENGLGDSGAQSSSGGAWGIGVGAPSDTKSDLPDGWKLAVDPSSGDTYYWNEKTKETSWERPQGQNNASDNVQANDDGEEELEEGWEQVEDPQSGQPYYWHRTSNETTWTKPVKKTVSLGMKVCRQAERETMKNTARAYSNIASGGAIHTRQVSDVPPPSYEATASGGRQGSVKKQKQLQKTKESLLAKQAELSSLVGKLEDRDTQQQAFISLLELLPQLDRTLVADLYARVEKNKNPGRSSTRRMFVLIFAAMAKCHPTTTARLLPRMLAYVTLRLRDKEVQITDACAILCSAIALYVVPFACVNDKGNLSPRKRAASSVGPDSDGNEVVNDADEFGFHTFENLIAHLSREANAVGEHATKCISSIIRPIGFDGSTPPPSNVIGPHGKRVAKFLCVLIQSLVAKMNESTQYAGFSPTFQLLQAILALAKTLKMDCGDRTVYDIVLPHLGSLVDAIEDVFRDGPRADWGVRKRGISLLVQLLDLFVCGDTAEENAGRQYFDRNLEGIRRLVTEARHDPVSAVRDAALPAVFLFDRLVKLFPRAGELPAPPSPFKRVYSGHGSSGGGSAIKTGFALKSSGRRHLLTREDEKNNNLGGISDEKSEDTRFVDSQGDESATPNEAPDVISEEENIAAIPQLNLTPTASVKNRSRLASKEANLVNTKTARQRIKIPRIAAPKSPVAREPVAFVPVNDDEDAFPEDHGDEHVNVDPGSSDDGLIAEAPRVVREDPVEPKDDVSKETDDAPTTTRAEAAIAAAADGETELALRLCFLEDDVKLLRRVLTLTQEPCTRSLSHASRTALCAAFLEFLDIAQDDSRDEADTNDMWLAFLWLEDLSIQARLVQGLDPRVLRALEVRLNRIAELPSRAGLVAADILAAMGL